LNEFKYDVAFSFLQEDEALAVQLNDRLKTRLKTFIYSERQLEIAGTDGEESFNKVYGEEARAVVVLYRDGWGQSGWTLIEKTAMKNRAFEPGYGFVLFIPVEREFTPPAWLPKTQLWIGIERWGIDVAAGVIEARIQELGGSPHEESAEGMAARLHHEADLAQQRKQFLWSEEAVKLAMAEFVQISKSVKEKVDHLKSAAPTFSFKVEEDYRLVVVLGWGCSLSFNWHETARNHIEDARLWVKFWDGVMPVRGQVYDHRPQELRSWEFEFDRQQSGLTGWRGENRFFTTDDLIDHCFKQFLRDVQDSRDRQSR
jgi:hypothetical protein